MKMSALNVDFSGPSLDPVDLKWSVHEGIKDGYPLLKSAYFTVYGFARPIVP